MRITKKVIALLAALLMMMVGLTAFAQVEGRSDHGALAVELNDRVYIALKENSLYSVSVEGGDMTLVDSGDFLDELVTAGNFVYYLRSQDDVMQIMRLEEDGSTTVLSEFEGGVEVSHLSWYDDVLYCMADNRLYIVDPDTGVCEILCEELMDEYVIVSDVIFYVSATDAKTYERSAPAQEGAEAEMLRQSSGTLWSMSILGTNPERLLEEGVAGLKAYGNYLFYHNLADNYIMGSGNEMWLEGKLYRYNIETQQSASLGLNYDWNFFPTDAGLVVYTSQDISLYPLTGGQGSSLMTPEARTDLTASGNAAYVYEYTYSRLTRLPLDGSEKTVLSEDSTVLPLGDDGQEVVVVGSEGADDGQEENAPVSSLPQSPEGYIFPQSSTKKLTREEIGAVDKSLWGYARNEIYARHGYEFSEDSKYGKYFSGKTWYKPGGFSTGSLNSIEWYNMELLKTMEQEKGLLSTSTARNSSAKNNYYVLKEASSRKLTKSYLRSKLGSKSKYALARNEILARHGYEFKTEKYRTYFGNQKWYRPGGYSSSKVSKIEWYNIELLKSLERNG